MQTALALGNGLGLSRRGGGGVTIPTAATATFGAKTIAGAGAFRPVDSLGFPLDLASYDSLVSGSLGSYVPSISGGGLRFTGGGAGAPVGAVLRCTMVIGGTIDITIGALEPNTYSVATLTEDGAAYAAAVLGDKIWLRAGDYNPTAARVIVGRSNSPAGTWTGTAALSDGNYVVMTKEPGAIVTIGAMEIGSSGGVHPRYLRIHDLDFVSPFNANGDGLGTGVSVNCNGQLHLGTTGGGHVAVTNCRFRHTSEVTSTTSGVFRAINSASTSTTGPFWIEGNTINGARHGIIGSHVGSVIRKNVIKRVLSDVMQIGHCTGVLIEGNEAYDKLYGYTPATVTAITRGASTVLTMADTSAATVNEPMIFSGVSGTFGAAVNGREYLITAKTATTVTVNLDSSALANWDSVSATALLFSALHGDFLQFNENLGATATQDNVTIRGNRWYRGIVGSEPMPDGQGIFAGATGTTANRTGWLIEGNIYVGCFVNGIRVGKLVNATIRSNTIVRQLGIDASPGLALPGIWLESGCSGCVVVDNIANQYQITAGTTSLELGNATISLVGSDDVPANATDVATYQAAFVSPVTAPDTNFDPTTAFATRTDGGSVYPGPIYPGATPYFNYPALTFTNPRVPAAMAAPTSAARSRSTALTITKAADPDNRGYAITDYDLRHSPDGTTWTTVTNPTFPYDITGLTPGQNYHIQTRANNVNGKGEWGASVQDKTSLVNFTATPTVGTGVTASAITDGWELTLNSSAGGRPAAWSCDGLIPVGQNGTFTFTIEISSTTDATRARAGQNSALTAIRGMDFLISGLSAGVPQSFTATITSAVIDTDWIGFIQPASTGAKTIRVTNLKLVTP